MLSYECKNRMNKISLVLLPLLLMCIPTSLYAQDPTGRIYGRVTDGSEAVVPGANVTITGVDTGFKRDLTTNGEGNYFAPNLQTGTYVVEVGMSGFNTYRRTGIVVGSGSILEVNISLQPGDISQLVTIEEAAQPINTTSGAVRTSIETVFIDRLPLNGRDANDMLKLVPGAVQAPTTGGGLSPNYSINGNRDTSNNYTLDGTDNSDTFNSKGSRLPPPDSLKEFTVQANYSAEFGRGGGAAIIALTRSGTNEFHGSIYDYFRSENLNANSFERNSVRLPRGEFKRHQLGFTVGGPVYLPRFGEGGRSLYDGRNKTFFFFNHQVLKTPASPYVVRRGGLTAAELAGDFSRSRIIPTVSSFAASQPNSPFAGMAGQQVTNLSHLISPAAVRWYNYFDLPIVQNSGDFFFENQVQSFNQPETSLRIDQAITDKNILSFSMFYRNDAPESQFLNRAPARFRSVDTFETQHYTLSDVWSFSPTVVNEFLIGYNRIWETRQAEFGDSDYSIFGFPWQQTNPGQFIEIGTLSPSEFNIAPTNAKYEGRDVWDFRNTLSVARGNHFFKFGAMVQLHNTAKLLVLHHGIGYGGDKLGNRAAEFLIGWPTHITGPEEDYYRNSRKNVTHFFFQDDWKVNRRLSLNLGIRYEPQNWAYVKDNRAVIFVPGARSQEFPNFPSGLLTVSDPGSPNRSGRENDMNNWAPRIGLAYRLDEDGRKVLRGGWGLFYDATDGNRDGINVGASFPFTHAYVNFFDRGYPANDAWLNPFAYHGLPVPNVGTPLNPATAVFDPRGVYGVYNPSNELGKVHQWNATFEHEFRQGWSYSAAYIGSRGVGLLGSDFWNVPVARDASDSWDAENLASRRPIQEYRYQTRGFSPANSESEYHAAQFTLKARSRFLHLLSHYTLSRARAHADGIWGNFLVRSHPTDLDVDWAPPNTDRPHNLLIVPTWDLPFFRTRTDLPGKILGGWSSTVIFQIQSGQPVDILAAQNNTFTCAGCSIRPNATGQPLINSNWRDDPNLVFVNPAAFSQPADRTFGNLPRNAIRWPYTKNVDFNLTKSFTFKENLKFDLKLDVFNLFNWVNFLAPESIRLGSNPVVFSMKNRWTYPPRTMQAGAKFTF